ncbi:hypothetical protein C1H46_020861 [Malus baccata]|uniref:Uncharacterized protein n=1 Tax=Malus baccata TaxID=106549 RepID=A0A540M447_MALBA|nr:hypothetical protein C1H46_020861 [Malus baccata]
MFASNNILHELFRVNQDSISQNRSLGNISKKLKYLVLSSGARFGFMLDEELKEAAACDEVKAALSVKISRERIGTEIDLMISGNQPVQAMAYISDWKLFWVVFSLHMKHEPEVLEGCDRLCVSYLEATWNLIQLIGQSTFTVVNVHYALEKFLFLIPYFASNEDALVSDVNWARESVDVPRTSKPRD